MVIALIGALCIGLSLGLLGSGGSILTVPVLKYVLHHEDKAAMAESLAIVGSIALLAAIPYAMQRRIDWRNVLWFGVPGLAGAYVGARAAEFLRGPVLLIIFALLMLAAAALMLKPLRLEQRDGGELPRRTWRIVLDGIIVGAITGLVGAGGGFLIIPALVLLGGIPMHTAVGTSLVIIAIKSASAFAGHPGTANVDWRTVAMFIAVGAVGSFAGNMVGGKLNQRVLRQVFGAMLIVMAVSMLFTEIRNLVTSPVAATTANETP